MDQQEFINLGENLKNYCDKYFIPCNNIFEILNDQKVVPMIRGKGMEYSALYSLREVLNSQEWTVQKLNLSAQPGFLDQDISIIHRRSGIIVTVESKSAARGSFRLGNKRTKIKEPHFRVKCHRSRSNIRLAQTSNDRYHYKTFDIVVSTPLNAIYVGNTIGDKFEFPPADVLEVLFEHYNVNNINDLEVAANRDWRYVLPEDIAENEFIPRTPYVRLSNDPNWNSFDQLSGVLLDIVRKKKVHKP